MDPQLLQRTRYVLKARTRHVKTCPDRFFGAACGHLVKWMDAHPILAPIAARLAGEWRFDQPIAEIREHIGQRYEPSLFIPSTLTEHAALCNAVIRFCAEIPNLGEDALHDVVCDTATLTGLESHVPKPDEAIEHLRDVAVDGLYEYLDERLDARNAIGGVLNKYRHRCEWFRKHRLRAIAAESFEGKAAGERALAVDLQEYIFDQGVEFHIEPSTASGEPDLVLRDTDGQYLVIDAKYIKSGAKPGEFKRKIGEGFHQVARYCHDYQEPSGFLIVFIEDDKFPELPVANSDGFDCLVVKGKTIYYFPVVIAALPSASKAGKAKIVPVTESDLAVVFDELDAT